MSAVWRHWAGRAMTDRTDTAPHRAYRLTLILEADTREGLAGELVHFAERVLRDEVSTGVSGGVTTGSIYELVIDPSMTHGRYFAEVQARLRAIDTGGTA